MSWVRAASLEALERGPVLYKDAPRQIAVFRAGQRVHAVDNRCPHEGYPLVEGSVDDAGLLTCHWHNWKFRLADGACVLGGDDVRAYPVELRDGAAWVDLSDPPPEQVEVRVLKGLRAAFDDQDTGRIAREIARLAAHGLDPLLAVRRAVAWSHDRFEYGMTHAYAAAADWLTLHDDFDGRWDAQLTCLAEAVDHIAHDALRRPALPFPESGAAGPDAAGSATATPGTATSGTVGSGTVGSRAAGADSAGPRAGRLCLSAFDAEAFARAVEAERREEAEGLVVRAVAGGVCWNDLEPAFAAAALAHYNDFGHAIIFVHKACELVARLGDGTLRAVAPALARELAYTTREDLLPEFKGYARALETMPEPAADDAALPSDAAGPDAGAAPGADAEALFGAPVNRCLAWTVEHAATLPRGALFDALLEASARQLLHYDAAYQAASDRPVSQNVGWLDFTHAITMANAVRALAARHPALWRPGLLQMACFVGRNAGYLDRQLDADAWRVDDAPRFLADVHERLLDHGLRDPIFACHLLKTARAVEVECGHASPRCQRTLLAALNRLLHSPIKQKHALRNARQAIALVSRDFA